MKSFAEKRSPPLLFFHRLSLKTSSCLLPLLFSHRLSLETSSCLLPSLFSHRLSLKTSSCLFTIKLAMPEYWTSDASFWRLLSVTMNSVTSQSFTRMKGWRRLKKLSSAQSLQRQVTS